MPLLLGRDVPKLSKLLGTSVGSTSSQSSEGSRSTSSESSVGSTSSESSIGSISPQSSVGSSSSTSSESSIGITSSESSIGITSSESSPVTSGSLDAVEVVAVTTRAQLRRQGEGVGQAVVTQNRRVRKIREWILMMNYLGTVMNALVGREDRSDTIDAYRDATETRNQMGGVKHDDRGVK